MKTLPFVFLASLSNLLAVQAKPAPSRHFDWDEIKYLYVHAPYYCLLSVLC